MSRFLPTQGPPAAAAAPRDAFGQYAPSNIPLVHQLGGDGMDFPRLPTALSASPYNGKANLGVREHQFPTATKIARIVIAGFFVDPDEEIRGMVPIVPFEGEKIEIELIVSDIAPWGPLANQAPLTEVHLKRRMFTDVTQSFGRQFTIDDSIKGLELGSLYESTHMQQLLSEMNLTIYAEFYKTLLNGYTAYALEHMAALFDDLTALQARESAVELMSQMTGVMSRSYVDSHPLVHVVQMARQLLLRVSDYHDISLNTMIFHQSLKDRLELTRRSFASAVTDANLGVIQEYIQTTLGISPSLKHLMEIVDWPSLYGMKVNIMRPFKMDGPGRMDLLTHEFATVQYVLIDTNDVETYARKLEAAGSGHELAQRAAVQSIRLWNYDAHDIRPIFADGVIGRKAVPVDDWFRVTDASTYGKVASGWVIAMRTMRLRTRSMVLASMGDQTGMMFVGHSFGKKYDEPALRRATTMMAMQFSVSIYHPQHVIILPDSSFVRYLQGGGTGLLPIGDYDQYATYARGDGGKAGGDVVVYEIPKHTNAIAHSCGGDPAQCDDAWFATLKDKKWLNGGGVWDDDVLYDSHEHNFLNPCTLRKMKEAIRLGREEDHLSKTCVKSPFPIMDIWRHGFHVSFFFVVVVKLTRL